MKAYLPCTAPLLAGLLIIAAPAASIAEPPAASVAEIQARHDRALIRELAEYLTAHPRADDRDQAYAALFNKAIEHDWFAEVEDLGRQYLKTDPDGPVKALAQIVQTMARAQAGRYDEALARFRELIKGLDPNEQEEFATSFSDSFASQAIASGEYTIARQAYAALLDRFGDSPSLRQKVQGDLKRLDQVGRTAPVVRGRGHPGPADPQRRLSGQVRAPGLLGDLVRALRRRAAPAAGGLSRLPRRGPRDRRHQPGRIEGRGGRLRQGAEDPLAAGPQRGRARATWSRPSACSRSPRPTSSIPRGPSSAWTSAARRSTRRWPG